MNLNEWMMKFLVLDGHEAETVAKTLAAVIRKDESAFKRLYENLLHDDRIKE